MTEASRSAAQENQEKGAAQQNRQLLHQNRSSFHGGAKK
jgi:hypothetical protein